jgi:hypothetical protein
MGKGNGLSFAKACHQSPLCHKCTNVFTRTHIGAFCSQHYTTHTQQLAMAPIPKCQKKSPWGAARQQGGGDSAVAAIVRWRQW